MDDHVHILVTHPFFDAPDGATIEDDEHGWITNVGESYWRRATPAEIAEAGA